MEEPRCPRAGTLSLLSASVLHNKYPNKKLVDPSECESHFRENSSGSEYEYRDLQYVYVYLTNDHKKHSKRWDKKEKVKMPSMLIADSSLYNNQTQIGGMAPARSPTKLYLAGRPCGCAVGALMVPVPLARIGGGGCNLYTPMQYLLAVSFSAGD